MTSKLDSEQDRWRALASYASSVLCTTTGFVSCDEILDSLAPIVDESVLHPLLMHVRSDECIEEHVLDSHCSWDRILDDEFRRKYGIFFTPYEIAFGMATLLADVPAGAYVADLSMGAASLLSAAIQRRPDVLVWGVEQDPWLAVCAAVEIARTRRMLGSLLQGDRVLVGDGLASSVEPPCAPAAVLGNPPYLGEKGNASVFRALRATHEHLRPWLGARVDLQYLFMHRALDVLKEGGLMIYLTSAYWVQATGARMLRQDLCTRAEVKMFVHVVGKALFADAPGHHSLWTVAKKKPVVNHQPCMATPWVCEVSSRDVGWDGVFHEVWRGKGARRIKIAPDGEPWALWMNVSLEKWCARYVVGGSMLGDLSRDVQGFVSGVDRWTSRHEGLAFGLQNDATDVQSAKCAPKNEVGAPVFLSSREDQPDLWQNMGKDLVRPLLRGRQIVRNQVWVCGHTSPEVALYVDGVLDEECEQSQTICSFLEPARQVLERRREVQKARIPWYRMHWPRKNEDQVGPKLVMARRGAVPCVALDLSAHAVSSDCTLLILEQGSIKDLLLLMIVLNAGFMRRYVRAFGKRKGTLYEFYAQPLQQTVVPLFVRDDGTLCLNDALAHHALGKAMVCAVDCAYACLMEGELMGLKKEGFGGVLDVCVDHELYEDEVGVW